MNFKQYVEHLNKMLKGLPPLAELPVIYSSDSEGNSFEEVHYTPSFGFHDDDSYDAYNKEQGQLRVNAVCIN